MSELPLHIIIDVITRSLDEDLGARGDITSAYTVDEDASCEMHINTREDGILAGIEVAGQSFLAMDEAAEIVQHKSDGDDMRVGDSLLSVKGNARALLSAERTALNLLGRMCGIATQTNLLAKKIAHTNARVCCTRKTTPGLRALEKYAVRMGGGVNHRFGLDDAILIKDNHIAVAGGVRKAVQSALDQKSHMVKLEVEVDTIDQLNEIADMPVDAVLLDNMGPELLKQAVGIIDGRFAVEASGGITGDSIVPIAESGVDLISVGWITHSAPWLDVGLDIKMDGGTAASIRAV